MGMDDEWPDPCECVLQEDGKKMSKKRRRLQLRVFDEPELLALDKEDVKYRINLLEQVTVQTYLCSCSEICGPHHGCQAYYSSNYLLKHVL